MPESRMITAKDAAKYCHIPYGKFPRICPVRPIQLHEAVRPFYDIRDLDKWIDEVKLGGRQERSDDEITNKL